jgi:hypothetical protein
MKKYKPTQKMLKAMDKTIVAYDLLIANPRERLNAWCFYGTTGGCQLCRAALTDGRVGDCTKCPIGITHSAISPGDGPCVTRTFDALEDALGCAGHLARSRKEHLDEDDWIESCSFKNPIQVDGYEIILRKIK